MAALDGYEDMDSSPANELGGDRGHEEDLEELVPRSAAEMISRPGEGGNGGRPGDCRFDRGDPARSVLIFPGIIFIPSELFGMGLLLLGVTALGEELFRAREELDPVPPELGAEVPRGPPVGDGALPASARELFFSSVPEDTDPDSFSVDCDCQCIPLLRSVRR